MVVLVPVPVEVVPPGVLVKVQVPVAGKPFKTTLPVATAHVGCVMLPTVGGEQSWALISCTKPIIPNRIPIPQTTGNKILVLISSNDLNSS